MPQLPADHRHHDLVAVVSRAKETMQFPAQNFNLLCPAGASSAGLSFQTAIRSSEPKKKERKKKRMDGKEEELSFILN
jgi:hypothetical protein